MSHNSYLSTESFEWHYMAVGALTIFIVPANQQLVDTPRYTNSTRLQRYARHSMVFFTRFPADIKCLCKKGSRTFVQFIYIYIYTLHFFFLYIAWNIFYPSGACPSPFALRSSLCAVRYLRRELLPALVDFVKWISVESLRSLKQHR